MKVVQGSGPKNAKILVLGEAPGETEMREGIPFIGPTGQILRKNILGRAGIREEDVRFDNVVQSLPSHGWNPSFDDIKAAITGLRARIRELPDLNLIIPVGGAALQAVSIFQYEHISKYRGSILNARLANKKMVPMVHPSWIVQGNYEHLHVSIFDAKRALEESRDPRRILPIRTHEVFYKFSHARDFLQHLLARRNKVAFDVETTLPCWGFSDDPLLSGTIPFDSHDYPQLWSDSERISLKDLGHQVLRECLPITQNGLFDKNVLRKDYEIDPFSWEIYSDTMYKHQLLYSELPHALSFLTSIYTREPFYKDEGRKWRRGVDSELQLFKYNGKDCCVTLEADSEMEEELTSSGQYNYFYNNIMPLVPVLYSMYRAGIKVDVRRLEEVKRKLKRFEIIDRCKLQRMCGFEPNPRSGPQMKAFYLFLGIPEKDIKLTPSGQAKRGEEELNAIYDKHPKPAIKVVQHLHTALTFQSNFTNIRLDTNSRYHAFFKPGPKSGRLASEGEKESFKGKNTGPQLQNIPGMDSRGDKLAENMRKVFVAETGWIFLEADLEQADARTLAYCAPEPALIELFESSDQDIHSQICSLIMGIPRNLISKDGPYADKRFFTKRFVHGVDYGMYDNKIVSVMRNEGIHISKADAIKYRKIYLDRFPGIPRYWAWVQHELHTSRSLTDLLGRKHLFLGRFDDATYREAYSRIPQATVAGVANKAMILTYQEIQKRNLRSRILLQVHDSIMVESPEEEVSEIYEIMRSALAQKFESHNRQFTIPAEFKIGRSWGEMKKYDPNTPDVARKVS